MDEEYEDEELDEEEGYFVEYIYKIELPISRKSLILV